ncbi:MAG: hypothetical protein CME67_00025 [Halobacteriovoraceae bacterium]|nr:hypothetical protein [Halobacteriovoraceae bacterium]|tara:strand:- start:3453 stop:3707 length:255 start_codon:yes stop_codon:yes gene_type:complete
MESPSSLENYFEFLRLFSENFKSNLSTDEQTKLIKKIVSKIELGKKDLKIHYFVRDDYIKKRAGRNGQLFFFAKNFLRVLVRVA